MKISFSKSMRARRGGGEWSKMWGTDRENFKTEGKAF
jgi:hypothetical protein